MRKPRDFDGELKALQNKARDLKSRKVLRLGELVIATGEDNLNADELAAGALIVLAETKEAGKRETWARRGAVFFSKPIAAKCTKNRPQHGRRSGATGRHTIGIRPQGGDMTCAWQVEHRKRTILGALLWMADKPQNDQGGQARALWGAKGKQAFEADSAAKGTDRAVPAVRLRHDNGD